LKPDPAQMPTIPDLLAAQAAQRPAEIALVCGEVAQTWAQLDAAANRVAHRLSSSGTAAGERVAVISPNHLDYASVLLGALRAGASVVPLPTMLAHEAVRGMLEDSRARVVFAHGSTIEAARDPQRPSVQYVLFDAGAAGLPSLAAWLGDASPVAMASRTSGGMEFNVVYSSGTTGLPKGIVHAHWLRAAQAMAMSQAFGFGAGSRTLIGTGLYSNFGLTALFATLCAGGAAVFAPRMTPAVLVDLCRRHAVTHGFLVPTQLQQVLASPQFAEQGSSLRMLKVSAGSSLRADIKRELIARWPGGLLEIYGMTEGAPVTVLEADRYPDKLESVGRPVPGCELKVLDDSGAELPPGTVGEIAGRTAGMMEGYHNRPEETSKLIWKDAEGRVFLKTGDLGRVDADGFVYILDRKKDMIISGGYNIYASDLESVLAGHPDVEDVAVVAVPSKKWGESPLAVVVPAKSSRATGAALLAWANERLGKFQRLIGVELRESLPRGALDKVLKRSLREEYRDYEERASQVAEREEA
jgi:long-chain acyl-CoA synthetase